MSMLNSRRTKQAHLQFALSNTQPKIAKELALQHMKDKKERRKQKARNGNTQYKKLGRKW